MPSRDAQSPQNTPPTVQHLEPLVRDALRRAGLEIYAAHAATLARYLHLLLDANARFNLTSITTPAVAVDRHIIEPLLAWRHLDPTLPDGPGVDLGSGGGAPGLPIAIVAPQRDITLVESRSRKAAFLTDVVQSLALRNVHVVAQRAEPFAHSDARETFAVALARALAPLPSALEMLVPLLAVDGLAAVFAGPSVTEYLDDAQAMAVLLGATPPTLESIPWPGADRNLLLVTTHKQSASPPRYPRRQRRGRRPPRPSN